MCFKLQQLNESLSSVIGVRKRNWNWKIL